MTTKTIAAEEYLCQLQLEILRLREVVCRRGPAE